jgi:nucleoside-diphosphate-sugar epimerase
MSLSQTVITGVAGFVGSHLAHAFLQAGVEVIGLDNLERGSHHRIATLQAEPHFTFVQGDIRDATTVATVLSEDTVVFHEAALIDVNESLQHPSMNPSSTQLGTIRPMLQGSKPS